MTFRSHIRQTQSMLKARAAQTDVIKFETARDVNLPRDVDM